MTTTPTQELVKRIRDYAVWRDKTGVDLMAEAADELERLANALEQAPAGRVAGLINDNAIAAAIMRDALNGLAVGNQMRGWLDRRFTTPTLQDTGVTEEMVERAWDAMHSRYLGLAPMTRTAIRAALEAAALTPRPQPDEREMRAAVAMAIERADNISIEDGYANGFDEDEISDWGLFLADAALAAMRRLTHPSNTPKADTGES